MSYNSLKNWVDWAPNRPMERTNRFKEGYKIKYDILVYPATKEIYDNYRDRKVSHMVKKGSHYHGGHENHCKIAYIFLNDSNLGNNIVDHGVISYYHDSKYYLVQLVTTVTSVHVSEKFKHVENSR